MVALAAALLPTLINGQGASSMHPIDFDGDGDIDIVKSSPIGIVWLENHGVRAGAPEKKHASPSNRSVVVARRRGGGHAYARSPHRSTRSGRRTLLVSTRTSRTLSRRTSGTGSSSTSWRAAALRPCRLFLTSRPSSSQARRTLYKWTSPAMWWGRRRATPSRNCSKWCLIRIRTIEGARAASAGPARYLRAVFPGGVSIRGTTFRGEARPKQALLRPRS